MCLQGNGWVATGNQNRASVVANARYCVTAVRVNANTFQVPYSSQLQPGAGGWTWLGVARQASTGNMDLIYMQNSAADVGSGNKGFTDYRIQQGLTTTMITQVQNKQNTNTRPFRSQFYANADTTRFYVSLSGNEA